MPNVPPAAKRPTDRRKKAPAKADLPDHFVYTAKSGAVIEFPPFEEALDFGFLMDNRNVDEDEQAWRMVVKLAEAGGEGVLANLRALPANEVVPFFEAFTAYENATAEASAGE